MQRDRRIISLNVAVSKLVGLFQVTAETSGQASGITSENARKIVGETHKTSSHRKYYFRNKIALRQPLDLQKYNTQQEENSEKPGAAKCEEQGPDTTRRRAET